MAWLIYFFAAANIGASAQYSLPMGEREAFMGNVGVARDGTLGNTYFNPGGLAFHKVNKLVGSGTLISISNQEAKEGTVKAKFSQTQTLPLAAGTAWSKQNWAWAFSAYNVNNNSALININYDLTGIGEVEGRARIDEFGIVAGPSFATKLSGTTGVGVTAFYYQQDSSAIVSLPFQKTVAAGTAVGSIYGDQKTTARSLKLVAGLLSKNEYLDFGLRFESAPLLTQAQRESRSASIIYVKNGTTIASEDIEINDTQTEKVKFERPHLLGAGVGALLGPRTRILSDIQYSLPLRFRPLADEDEDVYESSLRIGVGFEHTLSRQKWLAGATYIEDQTTDNTYLYLSAGLVSLDRRSDTAIGAFYLGTLKAVETTQTTIGLLFSSSIKL